MTHTLATVRSLADAGTEVITFQDDETPAGTFAAEATIGGVLTTALLSGDLDDETAPVIGHVAATGNTLRTEFRIAYGPHLADATRFTFQSYADAFARIATEARTATTR